MINFDIKKISDYHYNVIFKKTNKRSGAEETGTTLYSITLKNAASIITNMELVSKLGDVTLEEYMKEFHKVYKEVCKLLKKTL